MGYLPKHLLLFKQNLIEAGVRNPNYASDSEQKRAEKEEVDEYLMCLMLSGSDNGRYLSLKKKLEKSMLLRSDNYPKSREELLQVINYYKEEEGKQGSRATRSTQKEFIFLQQVGGKKNKYHDRSRINIKGRSDCFHCKNTNHWEYQCHGLTPEKLVDPRTFYYQGKQQHVSVHTQVGMVAEVGVSMLVKGENKAFQVPRNKSLNTNSVYL